MNKKYLTPELKVLELEPESSILQGLSGGSGSGSDMDEPDYQNPFGIMTDPINML